METKETEDKDKASEVVQENKIAEKKSVNHLARAVGRETVVAGDDEKEKLAASDENDSVSSYDEELRNLNLTENILDLQSDEEYNELNIHDMDELERQKSNLTLTSPSANANSDNNDNNDEEIQSLNLSPFDPENRQLPINQETDYTTGNLDVSDSNRNSAFNQVRRIRLRRNNDQNVQSGTRVLPGMFAISGSGGNSSSSSRGRSTNTTQNRQMNVLDEAVLPQAYPVSIIYTPTQPIVPVDQSQQAANNEESSVIILEEAEEETNTVHREINEKISFWTTKRKNFALFFILCILIILSTLFFVLQNNNNNNDYTKGEQNENTGLPSNDDEEQVQIQDEAAAAAVNETGLFEDKNNTDVLEENTTDSYNHSSNESETIFVSNSSSISQNQSEGEKESKICLQNTMLAPEKNFTCFTDPFIVQQLEWVAHEHGCDASIPRTYHFCSGSQMNVFGFDPYLFKFIYTSGDVFPLLIFRPNVNILCGEDGDYSNNCTFSGGFVHVAINERPIFVDYPINSTAENITISGFRFTGAYKSTCITMRAFIAGLTLKNCQFDNNHLMSAIIYTSGGRQVIERRVSIQNSVFENNTFIYTNYTGGLELGPVDPGIGVIISSPPFPSLNNGIKPNFHLHIHESLFYNNTFFDDDISHSAVLNLLPPVTSVEITNSCFVRNSNYDSAVILVGESSSSSSSSSVGDNNTQAQNVTVPSLSMYEYYEGNSFIDNVANHQSFDDSSPSSCNLNYQRSSLMKSGFVAFDIAEGCSDDIMLNTSTSLLTNSDVCTSNL